MARGRPSSVARLEDPLRSEVDRLVRAGWTIEDIRSQLASLGAKISHGAMGRYVKKARESMEIYKQGQEVARVWLDRLESDPQGDVGRLLPEMLRGIAFSTLSHMAEGDKAKAVKPMEVMLLAKAIKDLSATSKEAFAIEKARQEARAQAERELLAKQAKQLEKVSKAAGVTPETQAAIRAALGIG